MARIKHARGRPCTLKMKCFHRRPLSRVLKHIFCLFLFDLETRIYPTDFKHSSLDKRATNTSLRLGSSEQTNGSALTNNKMAVDNLIMRFSVHVNLLFVLFRNSFLLRKYNSKH